MDFTADRGLERAGRNPPGSGGSLERRSDATGWYLAGPKGKTVNVFFLDGIQTPYLETRQGWTVDGVEYKVRIDCGAKALDWRALYFNDGE